MSASIFDQLAAIGSPEPSASTGGDAPAGDTTTQDTSTGGGDQGASDVGDGSKDEVSTDETTKVDGETNVEGADKTATQTTEEENPYSVEVEETSGELPQQTLDTILKTPRGKEIYQNHKIISEISKPVSEGGIGHVPSVEQFKEYYATYRDRVTMDHHLNSGDARGAQEFINFAFGKDRGQGVNVVAQNLAETLLANNPQAFQAASLPFVGRYVSGLWERFKSLPDARNEDGSLNWSADKYDLYKAAQIAHRDLTGEFMKPSDIGLEPAQQGQPDPYANQKADLDRKLNEIRQWETNNRQSQVNNWNNKVSTDIGTQFFSEIDKALAPVKSMHPQAPGIYSAARKNFHDSMIKAMQANTHAWDIYQTRLAEARQIGSQEAANVAIGEFMKLAKSTIRENFRNHLKQFGVVLKTTSNARHDQLNNSSTKTDVGNNGYSPTPGKGKIERAPTETQSDFNLRWLKS